MIEEILKIEKYLEDDFYLILYSDFQLINLSACYSNIFALYLACKNRCFTSSTSSLIISSLPLVNANILAGVNNNIANLR